MTGLKSFGDFLGFTLVSIGGTVGAIGLLLLLARLGVGRNQPQYAVEWFELFAGLGVSSVLMLGGGLLLVRKSNRD